MSTRSYIAVQHFGGQIRSVYCHHDGNPSYVGVSLLACHNSLSKANALIELGSLRSVVGEEVVAYVRDYGRAWEAGNQTCMHENKRELIDCAKEDGAEYVYLFCPRKGCTAEEYPKRGVWKLIWVVDPGERRLMKAFNRLAE